MDEDTFKDLLESATWAGAYVRGETSESGRVTAVADLDVKAIRETSHLTQVEFARLVGVNVRTLQNWEQRRARPTGPARALLTIVAKNPRAAVEALHG